MSWVTLAQVESTATRPPRYQVNSVETGRKRTPFLISEGRCSAHHSSWFETLNGQKWMPVSS